MLKSPPEPPQEVTVIILKLLNFIASDEDMLQRFVSLSGLTLQDLKSQVEDPAFLAGVMDYALSDESLLVAFAANEGLKPQTLWRLRSTLPGFAP